MPISATVGRLLVKPGVDLGTTLAPAGARILDLCKRLAPTYDCDLVLTSGRDGVHSGPNDPHHFGLAFDLRTQGLSDAQKRRLLNDLRMGLYREPRRFYAFLEDAGGLNEHIHVQRRAGTIYTMDDYLNDR